MLDEGLTFGNEIGPRPVQSAVHYCPASPLSKEAWNRAGVEIADFLVQVNLVK